MFLDIELLLLVTQGTVTLILRIVPDVMNHVLGTVKKEVLVVVLEDVHVLCAFRLPCESLPGLPFYKHFFDTAQSCHTIQTRRVGAFNTAVAVEAAPEQAPLMRTPAL